MKFERIVPPNDFFARFSDDIQFILDACTDRHQRVHVLIEPEKKTRTTGVGSQNKHLNGHIQQITQATGMEFSDVKKYVKQMAISRGYPILMNGGNAVLDLWGHECGISEADATTAQCALLIDCVHQLAAELDVVLEEGYEKFYY